MVEPDQRAVTRVTRPLLGGKSCDAAQGTLGGSALRDMSRKKPRRGEAEDEGRTATAQFDALAASSPHRPGPLPLHDFLSKICDKTNHCANVLRGSGVPGHCSGQTGRDLASVDKSSLALPATQCRPTPLGINILDQLPVLYFDCLPQGLEQSLM